MKYALIGIGFAAIALVKMLSLSHDDGAHARKNRRSFPPMAKATYITSTLNDEGSGTGDVRSVTVACDPGDKALSGGFDEMDAGTALRTNSPSNGNTDPPHDRWVVEWINDASVDLVDVFVLCSDFPPLHRSSS